MVTVMQYMENLTDRQAAEAVRARLDWKYVLSLSVDDAGFDYSVLSEFRQRLLEGEKEDIGMVHCNVTRYELFAEFLLQCRQIIQSSITG